MLLVIKDPLGSSNNKLYRVPYVNMNESGSNDSYYHTMMDSEPEGPKNQ